MPFSPPYSAASSIPGFDQFYARTSGQTYQSNALIRKVLYNVWYDGKLLVPEGESDQEWTFNATTGTITFVNTITDDISILIQYADS